MFTQSRREPRTQSCALCTRMLHSAPLAVYARDVLVTGRMAAEKHYPTAPVPACGNGCSQKNRVHHTSRRSRTAAVPPPCLAMEERGWWMRVTRTSPVGMESGVLVGRRIALSFVRDCVGTVDLATTEPLSSPLFLVKLAFLQSSASLACAPPRHQHHIKIPSVLQLWKTEL